ncbi:MAG: DUF4388 domain-containing protein [Myxococcales bacterium]
MEGLAGDFGTMPVQDLVLYLGNRGLTGTLVCERGSYKKSVVVRGGNATNAASNDPREYLGQFLINFGHLTEDQLTRAFQTQAETRVFLGKILVMIGVVSEETVRQILTIKIRETMLEIFRWKEGTFRFARDVIPNDLPGVETAVPLLDVHREAEFRETAWEAMLAVFPSGKLGLQLDPAKLPANVQPGSLDARLFDAVREGLDIDEIGLTLHATDFHLYQRLYALYRQGVLKPVELKRKAQPEGGRIGEELTADDILRHAREFLSNRQYAEAEALAARAVELNPSPAATAVLKDAEAALISDLRAELLDKPRVPELRVEPVQLKKLDLTPPERYLLSRIDGQRDLRAIIRVSPLRELDALKYFRKFRDANLVSFRD